MAICILTDTKGNAFTGEAVCHDEDKDMMSEKTGCEIAYHRALVSYLKHLRDNEIKPAVAALKEYYYTMKHSKRHNPKSYESMMLQRKLKEKEADLDSVKIMIENELLFIKNYIDKKEKAYQTIRANRKIKEIVVDIDPMDKTVAEILQEIGERWPQFTKSQQIKIANSIIIGQK